MNIQNTPIKWVAIIAPVILLLWLVTQSPAMADTDHALLFDGERNSVELGDSGDLMGSDSWLHSKTVTLWLKPAQSPPPTNHPTSGELIVGTDRPRTFGITRAVYTDLDRIWFWNADADGVDVVGIDYTPGEWVHVAMVHDGTNLYAYKNGELIDQTLSGSTTLPNASRDGAVYMGGPSRGSSSLYYPGVIDEVQFWQDILSAGLIAELMTVPVGPEHPRRDNLRAYYRMSDGAGTTLTDNSGNDHTGQLVGGMGDASWIVSDALPAATPTPEASSPTATLTGQPTPTPVPPTATPTTLPTAPPTDTAMPPTNTPAPSETPVPPTNTHTPTPSDTPIPPTATPTDTATPTGTSIPPTATSTNTPLPTATPTDTATPTSTATLTGTPVPPTPTPTPQPTVEPGELWEVAAIDTVGDAHDLALVDNIIYVAATNGGLRVIDVSNPAQPQELGSYKAPRNIYGVDAAGDYAYVTAATSGLRVVDISDPTNPVEVGFFNPNGYAWDVTVAGEFAYIGDRFNNFHIVDISNPAQPLHISTLPMPSEALSVAVRGDYAYVATYTAGLRIIDIADPPNPFEVGSVPTSRAYGLDVASGYVYVADGGRGLRVIDVSAPTAPFEVGAYVTDGWSRSAVLDGAYIYLADWTGGLAVINVADPTAPYHVTGYATPGRARDIVLGLGHIFIADYEGGLQILSW